MMAQSKKEGVSKLACFHQVHMFFLPLFKDMQLPLSNSHSHYEYEWLWVVSESSTQWRCCPSRPWKERGRYRKVKDWISLLGWMWLKVVMGILRHLFCTQCHSECSSFWLTLSCGPANSRGLAKGHHAPAPVSGSCVVSHMFCAITSRSLILPAGRSWQKEKPCMKFYQLVDTSRVIIPQRICVVTWVDLFCIFGGW